ncbi:carboxylate/amino acid/amine transporter [Kushneria konosiri]|uniref:EamA family transporter n=1 Tax=Kushneria konosiri TaxID=698828 RepID=A0A2Z2H8D6_9GAMM|nr:carboxylate/amino acid/amine transporter [Kushneria konosiri]ARS53675.1 EamA family transporter [Kushneria konosiri]
MGYLLGVTLLWSFSFSLIGVYLAGQVDSYFAVLTRITLACLVFLPFLRPRLLDRRRTLGLMGIGAVQLGLMYVCYYQSFVLLSVPEILLFTIFTPIYIALLDNLLCRRLDMFQLAMAGLAVLGAALIRYQAPGDDFWTGFFMVQGANLCFAIGQVGYRHLMRDVEGTFPAMNVFGWFYVGALLVALPAWVLLGNSDHLPSTPVQWGVLAWLGMVASGAGYFLWNQGARRVDAATLAVMNNLLIPAGLLVNLLIWNRDADLSRIAQGGAVMLLALLGSEWWRRRSMRSSAVAAEFS